MQTKSFLKILLFFVNSEIFTSINVAWHQSRRYKTLDCDRSQATFIEVNFLKLMDNNKIFSNDFVCIHYPSVKFQVKLRSV